MSEYWTVSHGLAIRTGWSCRECKTVIFRGEQITVRDGRKMRLFYHSSCFSGTADPRTQQNSSFFDPRFPMTSFNPTAPSTKGHGKWSVVDYGYRPVPLPATMPISSPHQSIAEMSKSLNNINTTRLQKRRERERERTVSVNGDNISVAGEDKVVMTSELGDSLRNMRLDEKYDGVGMMRSSSVPPNRRPSTSQLLSPHIGETSLEYIPVGAKEIVWGFKNRETEKAQEVRKEMDEKFQEKARAREMKEEERKRRIETKSSQEAVAAAAEKAARVLATERLLEAAKSEWKSKGKSPIGSPKSGRPAFR
ncbi:hypothetical protein HK096_005204 [Nowakowskiella sp. JEL0078]|nr:hypothetical protein HK096_005204 [Nowakowskiella sp. JEL0078]